MATRRRYSIDFKKRVCAFVETAGVPAAVQKYEIARSTISRWFELYENGVLGIHPEDYGDARSLMNCIHCSGFPDTKDHNPSRVFLDEPYPDDLPVIGVCKDCNNLFSKDEPYLACLIEAARTGSAEPNDHWRKKARVALAHNKKMRRSLIEAQKTVGEEAYWIVDEARALIVIKKLAMGHAAFELHDAPYCEPSVIQLFPLHTLHERQRRHFETPPFFPGYPEVGSRALHRMVLLTAGDELFELPADWIVIQPGRYRYVAAGSGNTAVVRIVFSEYLGAEVIWNDGEPLEVPDFDPNQMAFDFE